MEEKNKQNYAGQVVDIPRSEMRISFKDCLRQLNEKDDDPYLNVFAPMSIYLVSIFKYASKSSLIANIPVRDMPLIRTHTELAEKEVFAAVNAKVNGTGQPAKPEENAAGDDNKAFRKFAFGPMAGKSPGDMLLGADDPQKTINELKRQSSFLAQKVAQFPKNQAMIDAIEEAIFLYEMGLLQEQANGVAAETPQEPVSGTQLVIYKTPVKHLKSTNADGTKNECYSMSIMCSPHKEYPYRVEIMNCYAPLGQGKGGIRPIYMDRAENVRKEYIDLTESEWLYVLDCLNENLKNAKSGWYKDMRQKDDALRWKRS